jgi:hypothetical protein
MGKRPRCAHCGKAFTPRKRGRPPKYCSAAHRQMAYALRVAQSPVHRHKRIQREVDRRVDGIYARAGIERVVIDVLRRVGLLPPERPKPSQLRLVQKK